MKGHTLFPYRDPHRWWVFFVICVVYFFVYFHRVSTSVIVSDLLEALHTNATALGFMSSMYFYLYAFEQPLVGYLSDRLGPRRVIGYWSMAAAAGCLLFGMAPNIGWASVGRALIGLGVGGVYVPAVKAISLWFGKKEFATMIGLVDPGDEVIIFAPYFPEYHFYADNHGGSALVVETDESFQLDLQALAAAFGPLSAAFLEYLAGYGDFALLFT